MASHFSASSAFCALSAGLVLAGCSAGSSGAAAVCPTGTVLCGNVCVPPGQCPTGGAGGRTGTGGTATGGNGTGGTGAAPATGGGSPTACTDAATASGNFATQYSTTAIPVTGGGKTYQVQTNWWNVFNGQTLAYNGLSFTIGDPNSTTVTNNSPAGFPSMFIGSYSGHSTVGSNLPKQVSALTTVPTIFSTNALAHDTSNYNAAYDVWFTANGQPLPASAFNPGPGGAYLMVWLFKPANRQPRGGSAGTANYSRHAVNGVPGFWGVWVDRGSSSNPPCTSYVAETPIDSLTFDLNAFIKDAVANNYGITNSMYLSIVFAGFEIWSGGNGLSVKQYCAKVN